ncbi:hypothetical protein PTKIN_Ptkin06aG0197900 [Pterospermum kingtungense]
MVPKNLFSEKLQRYKILIGGEWRRLDKVENSRTLKLRVNTSIDHLDDGLKRLLKKAEALYMEDLEGVIIVLKQVVGRDCFLHLKHLHIRKATEIQYIMKVNDDDATDKIVFGGLRSLTLEKLSQLISFCYKDRLEGFTSLPQHELPLFDELMELPCLENLRLTSINVGRIWHNQFSTLQNLTSLNIKGCSNLKYIFSSNSMAATLVHLESFEIVDCKSLREIIFTEDREEENQVLCPNLADLQLSSINVESIWHPNISCYVQNLEFLIVEGCHNLRCVFASSMMPLFTHLHDIQIYNCGNVEELISTEGITEEDIVNQILPKLTSLILKDLPKLMRFCHGFGSYLEFPLMKWLALVKCPTLKTFISDSLVSKETHTPLFNEKVAFPQLEGLTLVSLENCRKIWHNQLVADSFSKLNHLRVSKFDRLVNVFSFNMTKRLQNLEDFQVRSCHSLEEIFEAQVLNGVTATRSIKEPSLILYSLN